MATTGRPLNRAFLNLVFLTHGLACCCGKIPISWCRYAKSVVVTVVREPSASRTPDTSAPLHLHNVLFHQTAGTTQCQRADTSCQRQRAETSHPTAAANHFQKPVIISREGNGLVQHPKISFGNEALQHLLSATRCAIAVKCHSAVYRNRTEHEATAALWCIGAY
jgi:hypothetical protein